MKQSADVFQGQSEVRHKVSVDMRAHHGLRGILALHVAIFHYVMKWVNTFANVHMPFFFLLSGFSLAVVYRHRDIDISIFYQNRLARCLPLFYLMHAFCLPLIMVGYGPHPAKLLRRLAESVFPVATWFNGEGFGLCGPAWTISTLMAFYLLFPYLLPFLKQEMETQVGITSYLCVAVLFTVSVSCCAYLGDESYPGLTLTVCAVAIFSLSFASKLNTPAVHRIVLLWLVSLSIGLYMLYVGISGLEHGYWQATGWPVSRFPIFAMGCIAGLEVAKTSDQRHINAHLLGSSHSVLSQPPTRTCLQKLPTHPSIHSWEFPLARNADTAMGVYMLILLVFGVEGYVSDHVYENQPPFDYKLASGALLQLLTPVVQLAIIIALSQEVGPVMTPQATPPTTPHTLTYRLCTSNLAQHLGTISMTLYLVHQPLRGWCAYMMNGARQWPDMTLQEDTWFTCWEEGWKDITECVTFRESGQLSIWALALVLAAALLASVWLEHYVTSPLRQYFRAKPARPRRVKGRVKDTGSPCDIRSANHTANHPYS